MHAPETEYAFDKDLTARLNTFRRPALRGLRKWRPGQVVLLAALFGGIGWLPRLVAAAVGVFAHLSRKTHTRCQRSLLTMMVGDEAAHLGVPVCEQSSHSINCEADCKPNF